MCVEICPICLGKGKLKKKRCYGCEGKGWIQTMHYYIPIPTISIPYYWEPYVPKEPIRYYPCFPATGDYLSILPVTIC